MAVILIGEIINSCDSITGFNQGNVSTDDDFVQGTGSIGIKLSAAVAEIYTTTLGATAPYSFASGGGEFGYHIIMWFNTKTPVNATTGLTIIVGNGTSRGRWNVLGNDFYKGGFVTRVINTASDFNTISLGSWTLAGNPAQLSNVTEIGGGFTTITAIMGNFNNVQIDQITIGLGLRVDGGSVGTPNKFETVRVADEGTAFYGWWSSSNGSFIGKGKLYIGPATGTATSVFNDSTFTVVFSDSLVAVGFYEIATRGANTDVSWTLANISSANITNARWSLTIDSTTKSFTDTNGVWSGADIITLNSTSTLNATTIIRSNRLNLNGGTLNEVTLLSPSSSGFTYTDNLELLTNCSFESSGTGHAVVLSSLSGGTMSWRNFVSGYAVTNGSTGNEAIYVNVASGSLTINVIGGYDTPSIRTAGATITVVVAPVTTSITVSDIVDSSLVQNARVYIEAFSGITSTGNYRESVTITNTSTTATVTHNAHGLVTGDKISIRGANQLVYNGIKTITVTGANTYTYTTSGAPISPATGTITSTTVYISGLTDVNGQISDTRSFSVDQPIRGRVRRATTGTFYQTSPISSTISATNGLNLNVQLLQDQ